MNKNLRTTLLNFVVLLVAQSAFSQLASDDIPRYRTLPLKEQVRRKLEMSRYRFSILRLHPRFALRDVGYDNNVFGSPTDPVADWRSTLSVGTGAIVPLGSKMYLEGNVVPEYTWYRTLRNRRSFAGSYGTSLVGFFNRLTVQAGGETFRSLAPVNSELDRAALGTRTDASGSAELEILRRLSLFGGIHGQRQRYRLSSDERSRGISLDRLERNEFVGRGGVRYRFASFLDLSAAVETTRADFITATDRDNEGNAVLFGVHYDRPRTLVNLSAGSRNGKARKVLSSFPKYSTTTGSYYAAHELAARIVLDAYGRRGVVYGLYANNPYYFETKSGLGLTVPVGWRTAVRAFGERGRNDYPIVVESAKRSDNVQIWGGGVAFLVHGNIVISALASTARYVSRISAYDRSVFRFTTAVSLQRELFR